MTIPPLFLMIIIAVSISLIHMHKPFSSISIALPKPVFHIIFAMIIVGFFSLSYFYIDQIKGDRYYAAAIQYQSMNRNAEQAYLNALKLRPYHINSLINLSQLYLKTHHSNPAKAFMQKTLDILPDFPDFIYNLGLICAKEKNYPESLSYLKKTIELDPGYGPAQINLAWVYYLAGNRSAALAQCWQAMKLGMPQAGILIQTLLSQKK